MMMMVIVVAMMMMMVVVMVNMILSDHGDAQCKRQRWCPAHLAAHLAEVRDRTNSYLMLDKARSVTARSSTAMLLVAASTLHL